ncbi:MAG: hypothetical protein GY769_21215 [bacterium]|nr:hypothetical protein [bacterium]
MGTLLIIVVIAIFVIAVHRAAKRDKPVGRHNRGVADDPHWDPEIQISVTIGGRSPVRGEPSTSQDCWIPPGREARVGDRSIGDGFVYVGKNLPSGSEWGGLEPALIDPSLPCNDANPDRQGQGMTYWPSYDSIPPSCRSGYLRWLANGRSDPDAYIGYVFLYFYGLERRALFDAERLDAAREELPIVVGEVRRLLSVYGGNPSFSGYATQFLEFLRIQSGTWQPGEELPDGVPRGAVPLSLQVAVGHMALHGSPLPPAWALAWAKHDPNISLRTPARRCPEEFEELFRILYRKKHGTGLRLKACKRTISPHYRPASASFAGLLSIDTSYPDVMSLVGPRRRIDELAMACCDALDSYSRWLGRNPDGRGTLVSAAALPPELLQTRAPEEFSRFQHTLQAKVGESSTALLPADEILGHWFKSNRDKLLKKEVVEAAHLLGHAGFGFEPDVRFCGRRVARGDKIVVFPLDGIDRGAPSPDYSAAAILLHLAAMVSAADGEVAREEREHLRDHLAAGLDLDEAETRRLGAHLDWLLAQPPETLGGKKRLEKLAPAQRRTVGEFLIGVAWADGRVEPAEVKILTRIFRHLGLDPGSVHQWLHDHQTSTDLGPVPVTAGPVERPGYALSHPPEAELQTVSSRLQLDPAAIATKLRESERAAATLANIFADEDLEPTPELGPGDDPEADIIEGLDMAHTNLLRRLAERQSWSRFDYEELTDSLGLLPNGALDLLNDSAFELCEEPLIEGDEPMEINAGVAKEMLA